MKQKRSLLILAFGAFSLFSAFSQSLFQKSYDLAFSDGAAGMETLSNGHIIVVGTTVVAASGRKDILIIHLNAAGDILWSKTYSQNQSTSASAIQKTTDGNLLITFNTIGLSVNANASGWMKITPDGTVIWSKKAIGNSAIRNISPLASGGYLLCGQSFSAGGTQSTGLVVRIAEDGAIMWSTVFGENGSSMVADCWEDGLGFIHCCGSTSITGGEKNGFWAKLNAAGQLTGPVRRYGSPADDELFRLVPMGNNRLLLSGYTLGFTNSTYSAVWAVVVDYDGTLKSSKTFALAESQLTTNDLLALPGDQYLLALGVRTGQLSPAIMVKLSVDLDQLFTYQYKGGSESDAFLQVQKTGSGLVAAGSTYKNGDANIYLVTTDGEGKLNNEDCCPVQVNLIRQEVLPETVSFVPTQTAFYAVQNAAFVVADHVLTTVNLCRQINLDFSLSQDTICPGECVEITSVDTTAGVQYMFEYQGGMENPDQPGQICQTNGPVLFITLKAMSGGCVKSLTKKVNLGSKHDQFPNAFTPNGDGANDVFRPVFGCKAVAMHLQVFNRWGKKVFETTDPAGGWDGKINGVEATSDVYAWKLEYSVENNGTLEEVTKNGGVTLLR